jgi:hypothetical protein
MLAALDALDEELAALRSSTAAVADRRAQLAARRRS